MGKLRDSWTICVTLGSKIRLRPGYVEWRCLAKSTVARNTCGDRSFGIRRMFRGGCGHLRERRPDVDMGGSLYLAVIRSGSEETSRISAGPARGAAVVVVEECRRSHGSGEVVVAIQLEALGHAAPTRGRVRWMIIVIQLLLELQLAMGGLIMVRGALATWCRVNVWDDGKV